eukprot:3874885-Amphidinium_carterae.1
MNEFPSAKFQLRCKLHVGGTAFSRFRGSDMRSPSLSAHHSQAAEPSMSSSRLQGSRNNLPPEPLIQRKSLSARRAGYNPGKNPQAQ